jgi:preprotein translocase subunit SecG
LCTALLLAVAAGLILPVLVVAQPVSPAPPQVRKQQLGAILASPEFSRSDLGILERLGRAVRRATGGLFERVFGGIRGSGKEAENLSVLLAVLVVLFFVILLAYVLAGAAQRRAFLRPAPQDSSGAWAGPDSAAAALEQAAGLASSGDFRSAIRLVYLAVLLKLDEREMIRFDRTGTNWEYLSRLVGRPEIYGPLRPVTVMFDRKWYGREPAAESDYRSFLDAYGHVERAGGSE